MQFYIVNIDENLIVHGPFDTEEQADLEAVRRYGGDYWTNNSPYAIRDSNTCIGRRSRDDGNPVYYVYAMVKGYDLPMYFESSDIQQVQENLARIPATLAP